MLLPYLNKLKNANFLQVLSTYGKNANKLHFIDSTFVIHSHISIFSVFKNSEFTHAGFISCHCLFTCSFCDQFCGTGNSSQQTSQQCLWTINMVFSDENNILIKKTYNTFRIHSYTRRGIRIRALKMQFVCIFPCVLNICRKFEFLTSQGSVATSTCLRWGGYNVEWVCSKFYVLSHSVEILKIGVKIWQSYREFKGGTFLRHSVGRHFGRNDWR